MSNDFDPMPPTTAERGYDADWERLRDWCVARHIERHGPMCPGFMCDPHPSDDLTGHHVHAISEGGDNVPGPAGVKVLCRSCNVREARYRQHPWKRCPAGITCNRLPTGSPYCCEGVGAEC